jgi:hypothetical protein
MREWDEAGFTDGARYRPITPFKKSKESAILGFTSLPLSRSDHLIAILVTQGTGERPQGAALIRPDPACPFLTTARLPAIPNEIRDHFPSRSGFTCKSPNSSVFPD